MPWPGPGGPRRTTSTSQPGMRASTSTCVQGVAARRATTLGKYTRKGSEEKRMFSTRVARRCRHMRAPRWATSKWMRAPTGCSSRLPQCPPTPPTSHWRHRWYLQPTVCTPSQAVDHFGEPLTLWTTGLQRQCMAPNGRRPCGRVVSYPRKPLEVSTGARVAGRGAARCCERTKSCTRG